MGIGCLTNSLIDHQFEYCDCQPEGHYQCGRRRSLVPSSTKWRKCHEVGTWLGKCSVHMWRPPTVHHMHLLNHSTMSRWAVVSLSFLLFEGFPRVEPLNLPQGSIRLERSTGFRPTPTRFGCSVGTSQVWPPVVVAMCSTVKQCCAVLCSAVQICMWKCSIIESLDCSQSKTNGYIHAKNYALSSSSSCKWKFKPKRTEPVIFQMKMASHSNSWTIQHASHKCQLQPT